MARRQIGANAEAVVGEIVAADLAQAGCAPPTDSAPCMEVADAAEAQVAPARAAAGAAGIDAYAKTGHYVIEYLEDIRLFGASFNTVLGTSGWALQGEYSFRRAAPLQIAERKVFADALEPLTGLSACIPLKVHELVGAGVPIDQAQLQAGPACIGENVATGLYDTDNAGYVLRDVSQVQATATKVFGPTSPATCCWCTKR